MSHTSFYVIAALTYEIFLIHTCCYYDICYNLWGNNVPNQKLLNQLNYVQHKCFHSEEQL